MKGMEHIKGRHVQMFQSKCETLYLVTSARGISCRPAPPVGGTALTQDRCHKSEFKI